LGILHGAFIWGFCMAVLIRDFIQGFYIGFLYGDFVWGLCNGDFNGDLKGFCKGILNRDFNGDSQWGC